MRETIIPLVASTATIIISLIVMVILVRGQRKKVEAVFEMLKTRGPMTLDEIATATGTNVVMKGYLMMALEGKVQEAALTKILPPPGHPRLRIGRDTKYGLAKG